MISGADARSDGKAGDVRERVRRLFEFLKRFEERRSPIRRDIEELDWLLFFSDLPRFPVIKTGQGAAGEESPSVPGLVLSVERPRITESPAPPDVLAGWLLDGWKDPVNKPGTIAQRALADGRTESFSESSRRVKAAADWLIKRAAWADAERPAREALAVFDRVLALWARLQRDGESVRVLLGDGHLLWKRPDDQGLVRHPLILQEVELRFDETKRELAFIETDSAPFLYTELLSTFNELDGERRKACRSIVDKAVELGTCNLLGGSEVDEILRSLAGLLSASDAILPADAAEQPSSTPRLQRDPVLFLVPRATGFRGAYEAFLDRLAGLTALPVGLALAVGVSGGGSPRTPQGGVETSPAEDPETDLFFTKPSNEAQERIVRRLAATGAVLVQGPPGTGKTHTIANLIGHLLAEGKSVLVTAQTSKALRVVREKVVDELKPLCVSVLDSDIESRGELEHAVNSIVAKLTSDAKVFELGATARHSERVQLLKRIQTKERDLRTALHSEIDDIVVDGRGTHPSEAARCVTEGLGKHDWLPGPVEQSVPLPLSEDDLALLYRLNAELKSEDEDQIRAGLPQIDNLIRPEDFRSIVRELQSPLPKREEKAERWEIPAGSAPSDRLERLAERIRGIIAHVEKEPEWVWTTIHASLLGGPHQAPWDDVSELLAQAADEIASLSRDLLDFDVAIMPSLDVDDAYRASEEILAHLTVGGGLGWLSLLGKASWTKVLDGVKVNGRRPAVAAEIQAVRRTLRVEIVRRKIQRRWDSILTPAGLTLDEGHRAKPEEAGRARLPEIRRAIRWARDDWSACVSEMEAVSIPWQQLVEATYAKPPHAELWRILKCARKSVLPAIELELERQRRSGLRGTLQRSKEMLASFRTSSPAREALAAVEELNPDRYLKAHRELDRLHTFSDRVRQRDACISKIETVARAWAERIRARSPLHQGPDSPGDVRAAWEHRQFAQELDRRMQLDPDGIQREISALNDRSQQVTCSLVENLAWRAQVRRTNPEQHRALMSWLDLVKRVGKGTGKRADEYRRSARQQLELARSSVPVWIMPLSRVAESFVVGEKLFDVVILDEASQCDISALVAFALGQSVVVVGDDEQVSPLDIGQRVEEVRALQEEWLDGFKDQDLFDGRASAYEIGRRSFPGGLIRLVEHFRCVPDIIAFSNSLSYKDEIRPLRESSSAKVFPPVLAHRVVDGERTGNAKVNRAEALEIASLVFAVTDTPEYTGLECGVISLLGDEQAREIDTLLQRFLDPITYKKRRIICGTAAHFQGDERDVMFLSVVDSPMDGPHRLLDREDMKKRYNVAASRARDQLWVVHSLDAEKDLKPDDLRRRLLVHAMNPTAWRRRLEQEGEVESEFERQVLRALLEKSYRVRPQVEVGAYRLDLVVEGNSRRVAIECDGDRFHSLENLDKDLERQAILERLGWRFIRIRGSAFFRDACREMQRIFKRLDELGIEHLGSESSGEGSTMGMELRERVVRRAAECRREWIQQSGSVEELFAKASRPRSGRWRSRTAPNPPSSSDSTPAETVKPRRDAERPAECCTPHIAAATTRREPEPDATSRITEQPSKITLPRSPVGDVKKTQNGAAPRSSDSDPLFEAISTLLPPTAFVCPACKGKRRLWIGQRSPTLKCEAPNCSKTEVPTLDILRKALSLLSAKCDCGAAVRVVRVATADPFVGCSAYPSCSKTYPWPVVHKRLSNVL